MDRADDVYNAMKTAAVSPAMAAVNLNETQPALQHDVAAVKAQAKAKPKGAAAGGTGTKPKRRRDPADRTTWGRPHKDSAHKLLRPGFKPSPEPTCGFQG